MTAKRIVSHALLDGVRVRLELLADQGELAAARLALAKIRLVCGNTRCNEYVGLAGVIAAKAK